MKYYTNFDFFYKRTCFRFMTLFFKVSFKPYLDKWQSKRRGSTLSTASVNPLLIEFTQEIFPGLFESLHSDEEQIHFIEYLKLLLFSHRHNKNDGYLKDTIASFDLVRDTMYKYSKQAEAAFLAQPVYSFLFACFSLSTKGQNFA